MIDDYFASIPTGKNTIVRPSLVEKTITKEIIVNTKDKNAQVPALILAYRTPRETDRDSYVYQL